MYAIVEIAGQQFKVKKDQRVFVHRLNGSEGDNVEFGNVLLLDNNGSVSVGAPAVDGAMVKATINRHVKGDKVIVFKKKRRKGYQKSNGHRQQFTELTITDILSSGAKKSASKKAAAPKKEEAKKEAPAKASSAKQDDLTMIDGIGAAYAEAVRGAGYTTFEQLSKLTKADIEKLSEIDGIGAELIESGDWKAQAKVLYGFQKVLNKVGEAKEPGKDNLEEISGIGPETVKGLNSAGIFTFEQISKLGAKEMEYLEELKGVTKNLIQSEEWVKQAKAIIK